jgi:hypothetical protein
MISIPLSLAIGLFILDSFGFTINQLSIVGFVVALVYWLMTALLLLKILNDTYAMAIQREKQQWLQQNKLAWLYWVVPRHYIFAFLPLVFLPEGAGDFIRSLPAQLLQQCLPLCLYH